MNKTTLWLLLVTAGAAFGLGYVTGPGTGTSSALLDVTHADTTPYEQGDASSTTLRSGSQGPRLAAAAPSAPSAVHSGIEAVLDALPTPTRQSGEGTITGEVITATGEPLAGVTIVSTPYRKDGTQGAPLKGAAFESLPLEERIRRRVLRLVETARWNEVNKTEAVSGADGSFTLSNIGNQVHDARALLDGWKIWSKALPVRVRAGERIKFIATRLTGVKLQVFGPDGNAPVSARASFRTDNGSRRSRRAQRSRWTPEQTLVKAKPGNYQLIVEAGKHRELRGGPIDVEISKEESSPIRVDLSLVPIVLLKVALPEGEGVRGELRVLKTEGPEKPTDALLKGRGKQVYHFPDISGSTQVLTDLNEGWYAVGFSRGVAFDVVDMLHVEPGVLEHTLTVPPMARDRYVVARVTRPDGNPVVGADIAIGSDSRSRRSAEFSDRSNGEYMVMLDAYARTDGAAAFWIEATSSAYGQARVTFNKVEGQTLDLQFKAPSQAQFTIEGASPERATLISIGLTEQTSRESHLCDADGKVTVQPLQPGTYFVALSVGSKYADDVALKKVTIQPGKNHITLALPTLYTITVRGSGPRVRVTTKRDSTKPRSASRGYSLRADSVDGEAVLDGLPVGEYRVISKGRKDATFTLPGTTVVTLEEEH